MTRILFICHGNICRSAAAEMVMKQMAREQGRKDLQIASAAATREEIGKRHLSADEESPHCSRVSV